MYNSYQIPQNFNNFTSESTNNNYDSRLVGGGFVGPFLLGGLTGGLVAPFFYGGRPGSYYNNYYYPPYPRPYPYPPYRPYR